MPIVSIPDSNKDFEVIKGEVLYDSLHDQGEELPHGCLSGSCGACRVEIIEGSENLSPPGAVENDTVKSLTEELSIQGKVIRLSCRAKVLGNISFRPIK